MALAIVFWIVFGLICYFCDSIGCGEWLEKYQWWILGGLLLLAAFIEYTIKNNSYNKKKKS